MSGPRKVLIVDDSAVMRELLRAVLDDGEQLKVVGAASDPVFARQRIAELKPDVLTLDIEMPRMDGISFLEELMRTTPLPVVMISSLTERGATATLRALELGAFDFVTKPTSDVRQQFDQMATMIRTKVRAAAAAGAPRVRPPSLASRTPAAALRPLAAATARPAPPVPLAITPPVTVARRTAPSDQFITIAASTGGTEALRTVIPALPADAPGVVVVQHMPEKFTAMFAARLDEISPMTVREAREGDVVQRGTVLIAPGGTQCVLEKTPRGFVTCILPARTSELHNPSANVLFDSVARVAGRQAIGAVLTGMGDDGARGLAAMRSAGARTLAQDQKSSIVFGMPREAIKLGGAEVVVPLERVADALMHLAGR